MSSVRNDYVIVGYDFTQFKDDLYDEEWAENPDNEEYWCHHEKGNIQMFDDPMDGDHLYFGYIISANDEYDNTFTAIPLAELERQKPYIDSKLNNIGWNISDIIRESKYQLISFSEYR